MSHAHEAAVAEARQEEFWHKVALLRRERMDKLEEWLQVGPTLKWTLTSQILDAVENKIGWRRQKALANAVLTQINWLLEQKSVDRLPAAT